MTSRSSGDSHSYGVCSNAAADDPHIWSFVSCCLRLE